MVFIPLLGFYWFFDRIAHLEPGFGRVFTDVIGFLWVSFQFSFHVTGFLPGFGWIRPFFVVLFMALTSRQVLFGFSFNVTGFFTGFRLGSTDLIGFSSVLRGGHVFARFPFRVTGFFFTGFCVGISDRAHCK